MNNNYQVIYTNNNGNMWWYDRIIRFLIPDKIYFYNLFIDNMSIKMFKFLPLRPYMNNIGFKL